MLYMLLILGDAIGIVITFWILKWVYVKIIIVFYWLIGLY